MRKAMWLVGGVLGCSLILAGCSGPGPGNRPGRPVTRISPSRPGEVAGLGIESQDLQEVADKKTGDFHAHGEVHEWDVWHVADP